MREFMPPEGKFQDLDHRAARNSRIVRDPFLCVRWRPGRTTSAPLPWN